MANVSPKGYLRLCLCLLCGLACLLASAPTQAASDLSGRVSAAADSVFNSALASGRINAGAVVLVQDGQVRLVRTYGYEDLGREVPASACCTRLPIASVSKTFTGLAIAQLISTGKIKSVDDPVNRYLKGFQVHGPYADRLTIRNLLTHSGGFDEETYGTYTGHLDGHRPDASDFARHLPPIIRPPGQLTAYANESAALAGAVIEGASGQPYGDYLRDHIFGPAGMTRSLVAYQSPVPHEVRVYQRSKDRPPSLRGPIYADAAFAPAGGIMVTADDMARYMIALTAPPPSGPLNEGVVDRALTPLYGANPGVQTHAMFFEVVNQQRGIVVHHGGSLPGHQGWMFLSPAQRTGLYVYLSDWQVRPPMPFEAAFWRGPGPGFIQPLGIVEAVTPIRAAMAPAVNSLGATQSVQIGPENSVSRYVGLYRGSRRVHQTMLKFMSVVFAEVLDVTASSEQNLSVNGQGRFHPVGAGLFEDTATGQRLGFRDAANGQSMIADLSYRSSDFEKIPRWADPRPYGEAWWGLIAIALTGFAAWLWPSQDGFSWRVKLVATAAAITAIGVPLALFAFDDNGFQFLFGGAARLVSVKLLSNLSVPIAFVLAWEVWRRWRAPPAAPHPILAVAARLHLTLLVLTAMLLVVFYGWVHFLGFGYP